MPVFEQKTGTGSPPSAHRSIDDRGRLLPMTDQQRQDRSKAIALTLDQIATITDETDTDEVWERFKREIDEDRLADRKRYR